MYHFVEAQCIGLELTIHIHCFCFVINLALLSAPHWLLRLLVVTLFMLMIENLSANLEIQPHVLHLTKSPQNHQWSWKSSDRNSWYIIWYYFSLLLLHQKAKIQNHCMIIFITKKINRIFWVCQYFERHFQITQDTALCKISC